MHHYERLGLKPGASRREIKQAYKKLSAKSHPDKGGDPEKHQELTIAYNVLVDDEKRDHYDKGQDPTQGKPPEKWRAYLTTLFNQLILEEFQGNIIQEATARNINAITGNQAAIGKAEQIIRATRKKLGRITVKEGEDNLYEAILNQAIEYQQGLIAKAEEEIEICGQVAEHLAHYTDTKPDGPDLGAFPRGYGPGGAG